MGVLVLLIRLYFIFASGSHFGVKLEPSILALVPDWPDFIREPPEDLALEFHKHENTGRPLGSQRFIERVENSLGRLLTPRRPGPPPSGLSAADGDFAESGLG